jgi:hypothetical protein
MCTRFTCDTTWDISSTILWAAVVDVCCVAADIYPGHAVKA